MNTGVKCQTYFLTSTYLASGSITINGRRAWFDL